MTVLHYTSLSSVYIWTTVHSNCVKINLPLRCNGVEICGNTQVKYQYDKKVNVFSSFPPQLPCLYQHISWIKSNTGTSLSLSISFCLYFPKPLTLLSIDQLYSVSDWTLFCPLSTSSTMSVNDKDPMPAVASLSPGQLQSLLKMEPKTLGVSPVHQNTQHASRLGVTDYL